MCVYIYIYIYIKKNDKFEKETKKNIEIQRRINMSQSCLSSVARGNKRNTNDNKNDNNDNNNDHST